MGMQHVENLLRRYRGQSIGIKTVSGGSYQGTVIDIANDYVALSVNGEPGDQVFVMFHSIESVQTKASTEKSASSLQ